MIHFLQVSSLELAQLPVLHKDKPVPCIVYIQQIGSSDSELYIYIYYIYPENVVYLLIGSFYF